MYEPAVKLHCSNPSCQGVNPPDANFCQHCRVPLVRRYLWAMGAEVNRYPVGGLIGDRYWLIGENWVIDTQPALSPQLPGDIPPFIQPYLRLVTQRPHIPQVYGQVIPTQLSDAPPIWLFEYGIFPANTFQHIQQQEFCPSLTTLWGQASPLRQLNWLWQMAQLWQPLQAQKVASTLLNPALLRVHHTLLLVRELHPDAEKSPSLAQLGQLWQTWLSVTKPALKPFLEPLCEQMIQGNLKRSDRLIAALDRGLEELGRIPERSYQIYTRTDTGPQRHHNEDACFPEDGTYDKSAQGGNVLAIVCDGIGGHDGGEIASQIAIETIQQGVTQLSYNVKPVTPIQVQETLEQSTCAANDAISDRNDSEQRHERQRMGTTLVMALGRGHEMYFAHVGDSRIYWLTRSGCYQVTLDDDVASREVRLGYALHRDALQYPSGGALVQALGMGSSAHLRPTIARKILDEDGLFLLCSDGLSDFDRVEQYWETEILPVLTEDKTLAAVGNRLIEIANQQNGHDNVTIALVACQLKVNPSRPWPTLGPPKLKTTPPEPTTAIPSPSPPSPAPTRREAPSPMPEAVTVVPPPRPRKDSFSFLLALGIFLGLSLGLAAISVWFFPEWRSRLIPNSAPSPTVTPTPTPTVDSPSPVAPQLPTPPLNAGDAIALTEELILYADPQTEANSFPLPPNTVVRVLSRQNPENANDAIWLEVEGCIGATEADTEISAELDTAVEPPAIQRGWTLADNAAIASGTRLTASEIPESCL